MRFLSLCGRMLLALGAAYVDCDGASVVIESLLVPIHQLPMYQTAGRQLRLEAPAGDGRTYRIEGTVPAHQLLEPALRAALKDLPEDLLSEAQKDGLMERAYASVLGYEPRMPSKRYDARISRTHFLAVLAAHRGYKDYLEIGCDNGFNFCAVTTSAALRGTYVDPLPGGTQVMTSDEFFSQYQGAGFDLVFIDGMHEKHQVLRDVNNALKWLKQGGTIVLHDCAPRNRSMAQRLGVEERRSHLWNGDVYRAVIERPCRCGNALSQEHPLRWRAGGAASASLAVLPATTAAPTAAHRHSTACSSAALFKDKTAAAGGIGGNAAADTAAAATTAASSSSGDGLWVGLGRRQQAEGPCNAARNLLLYKRIASAAGAFQDTARPPENGRHHPTAAHVAAAARQPGHRNGNAQQLLQQRRRQGISLCAADRRRQRPRRSAFAGRAHAAVPHLELPQGFDADAVMDADFSLIINIVDASSAVRSQQLTISQGQSPYQAALDHFTAMGLVGAELAQAVSALVERVRKHAADSEQVGSEY
ncbi:hypothetical protein JKP88DRAFT_255351 [Tribonema minus]|uniref:Class I SAM-dependent methyltransferase n=1 Tax=Tribonema minus TaxID=303371 RepID=A0A835Z036_9STRA|nr:hypothetical protein JKP88DRAFT_255351 [Tribonema minus]